MATATKPNPFPAFSQLHAAPKSVAKPESEVETEEAALQARPEPGVSGTKSTRAASLRVS